MSLIECVPNFSEGRDPAVISAIREAIAATPGAFVLDVSSDPSHHRSVITFVATLEAAVPAAFAAMQVARDRIDLTRHVGEHPRIGATDVVPFIPLEGATMSDCIALARQLGARASTELDIPVYLYERAASTPARENLADVRRGEFEGLRQEITVNPARHPDFGDARLHPTAGATAIGARPFLVAYNVYLGDATNLPVARAVAKALRGSSGGLRFVKALGLEVDGQAQVSMNLVDTDKTPLYRVFEMVKSEAAAYGITPTWSEIVGLVPERVLLDAGARHVQLRRYSAQMLLETQVRSAIGDGESLNAFVSRVASAKSSPGGGSVAALAGALGAALAQMVAGRTVGRPQVAAVEAEMQQLSLQAAALRRELTLLAQRDADACEQLRVAHAIPIDKEASAQRRAIAIRRALVAAAEIPLDTARAALRVAAVAATAAERGNQHGVSDACVAALLAEVACRSAVLHVRVHVAALDAEGAENGDRLAREARACLDAASVQARLAESAAERSIGRT